MGGIETWSRTTPDSVSYPVQWMSGSTVQIDAPTLDTSLGFGSHRKLYVPTQTTTSYRSSGERNTLDLNTIVGTETTTLGRGIGLARHLERAQHDTGHEFYTEKFYYSGVTKDILYWYDGSPKVVGFLFPKECEATRYARTQLVNLAQSANPDLETQGVKAIRNTNPTRSPADLAQALAELKREGLPSLIGLRAIQSGALRKPATAGNEYLNLEFGIKPLLRDLQSATAAVLDGRKLIDDFREQAGKRQHRQYTFPTSKESTVTYGTSTLASWPTGAVSYCISGSGPSRVEMTKTTRSWFSGAWKYFLDDASQSMNRLQRAAEEAEYLLGLRLTPELLWEITPWSWLIDWVTNVGDNISNLQSLAGDDLVLQYGYMMRHIHATRRETVILPRKYSPGTVTVAATLHFESKQRIRATPYGFGLDTTAFTGKQWAILSALGMTRGNRSLRLND